MVQVRNDGLNKVKKVNLPPKTNCNAIFETNVTYSANVYKNGVKNLNQSFKKNQYRR